MEIGAAIAICILIFLAFGSCWFFCGCSLRRYRQEAQMYEDVNNPVPGESVTL